MQMVIALLAGVAGIVVGGVLNVLADDLPQREAPGVPRYPDGSPRPPVAWLGLMAFLTGRRASPPVEPDAAALGSTGPGNGDPAPGRSRRLGWRHPLLELATGLAFAGLAVGFPDEPNRWSWFVYVAILLLITVIDIEHRLILFVVILPACAFALLVAAVAPQEGKSFQEYALGGLLGFGLFFAMFLGGAAFTVMTRHEEVAFGFGDVMLATLSGLMLGWRAFIFAALITVFAGAMGAMIYLTARAVIRRRYRWFTPLPYGPYIVIGTLIMLLFREEVQEILRASTY